MAQSEVISCRIHQNVKRSLDEYLNRHPGLTTQQLLKIALLRYMEHVSALTWEIPDHPPEKGMEAKFLATFKSVDGNPEGFWAFVRTEAGSQRLVNWRETEVLE